MKRPARDVILAEQGVLHVYKDFPPVLGGIEGHLGLLTRLLDEQGLPCAVLCSRRRGMPARELRGRLCVERRSAPLTLASTPLPPALPWALRRHGAALVHLHYPWPPGEVAWLVGGRGRPLVVSVHCEAVRYPRLARWLSPLSQRVLARAQRILVASSAIAQLPLLARHRERVRIVPYGVDLESLHPGRPTADPLPEVPHPRLLFVGRLRHYKGLPVIAAALSRLPGAHLLVVGEGPERARLESALEASGCRERAHLLGEVSEERLLALRQSSDAALLASTSRAEAFGLAIAEAQACGLPAVTTELATGTAQSVADGASGRVVPPDDPDALATALAWCIDSAQAPARRTAARRHAEQHLCARRMARQVREIYEEIANAAG
jgi:glycosyltransferase involved in cell wall biosynthesis